MASHVAPRRGVLGFLNFETPHKTNDASYTYIVCVLLVHGLNSFDKSNCFAIQWKDYLFTVHIVERTQMRSLATTDLIRRERSFISRVLNETRIIKKTKIVISRHSEWSKRKTLCY